MSAATRTHTPLLGRLLPLLVTLGVFGLVTVALGWLEVDWEAVAALGYGGLFLACLASSATVAVPVPAVIAVFFAGKLLNPVLAGAIAGLGSAIGELSGYLVGRSGRAALAGATGGPKGVSRLDGWIQRHGGLAILVLAFIPNPFFDVAGMAAGAARLPLRTFFVAVLAGKTGRMILLALVGHYALAGFLP